jgi:hypothetical protein
MKLVQNARRAYRWFSMQAMALSLGGAAAWLAVPQELRDAVPDIWLGIGAVVLATLGMIGRLVDQGDG